MPVVLMIIAGIPLISLGWWWWADRRLKALGPAPGWRIFIGLMMILLLGGYGWVVAERSELLAIKIPTALYSSVLLWGLILLPFFGVPMVLGWSCFVLGQRIFGRKRRELGAESQTPPWSRRKWLGAAAVSLPALTTLGATLFSLPQMTRFRIRKLTLTFDSLPAALDGLKIAHVTDTHIGKFTRGPVLDEIVAATNALDADLILFTGDLIDNTIRAKSGLFIIEGNHDLFDDPAGFAEGIRAGGLNLLRNQSAVVSIRGERVQIGGIAWHHGEVAMTRDVEQVAEQIDPDAFAILLAHHPHAFDRAAELGFSLVLAGHTHGGQLMLTPDLGPGPMMFRYWSGLYQKGLSKLVVSNGTGNWFPLRLNAPAEIVELTLRSRN
jgi:predicted MPP superfamily phosphohydrolase